MRRYADRDFRGIRSIARRHPNWGSLNSTQRKAKYKEVWDKLHDLTKNGTNTNQVSQSYDHYNDYHFHIAF